MPIALQASSLPSKGWLTTVIPVFNGEKYLPTTLESVLQQTRPPDRLIILDNGSTDRTKEIAERFSGLKCEWRQNETNVGLIGNLNRALEFAVETDYLHLLMSDDLIKPRFYEKVLDAFPSVKGRALAYSFNADIDQHGKEIDFQKKNPTAAPRIISRNRYLARQSDLATVLLPATLFKTARLPTPCKVPDLPKVGDVLFLAEWALHTEIVVEIPEYLCEYRVHPLNTSSKSLANLKLAVSDEWTVMHTVHDWIREPRIVHWLRWQRLQCLFAARSRVKADLMKAYQPDLAREISKMVSQSVSPIHAWIGNFAVRLRNGMHIVRGRPTKTEKISAAVLAKSATGNLAKP